MDNPQHDYSWAASLDSMEGTDAAVGLETKFLAMKQTGAKPIAASFIAVVVVAVMVLMLIKALGV